MNLETLEHTSGHKFVSNGAGDYDLVCPTHGKVPGFVPYMLARCANPRDACRLCIQLIGDRIEAPDVAPWEFIEHRNGTSFRISARRRRDGFEIHDVQAEYGGIIPDHLL